MKLILATLYYKFTKKCEFIKHPKFTRPWEFVSRITIGSHIRDPEEYPILSAFTRQVSRTALCTDVINACVRFGIDLLGYVCDVTTLCGVHEHRTCVHILLHD